MKNSHCCWGRKKNLKRRKNLLLWSWAVIFWEPNLSEPEFRSLQDDLLLAPLVIPAWGSYYKLEDTTALRVFQHICYWKVVIKDAWQQSRLSAIAAVTRLSCPCFVSVVLCFTFLNQVPSPAIALFCLLILLGLCPCTFSSELPISCFFLLQMPVLSLPSLRPHLNWKMNHETPWRVH